MNWKKTTLFVTLSIVFFIVVLLVYDAFAVMGGGTEASISSLLISYAYKMPFMVFCIGFFNGLLAGHLFWRMKSNKDTIEIDSLIKEQK